MYRDGTSKEIEHSSNDDGPVYEAINDGVGKTDKSELSSTKEEFGLEECPAYRLVEGVSCDKVISLEICPAYVPTIRPGVVGGLYETLS